MNIEKLKNIIAEFAKERDWDKFHNPKNLVMALSSEVGELSDIFQWLNSLSSLVILFGVPNFLPPVLTLSILEKI